MSSTVLYMSMSLDGFIAGPNESPDNALGDGGHRLHEWALGTDADHGQALEHLTGPDREVFEEFMSTGAVLAGRGTFEPAGGWNGDHHDGVPIFILSRHEPGPEFARMPAVTLRQRPRLSRRSGEAGSRSEERARPRRVDRAMELGCGLLDEVHIHLLPVLLARQGRDATHLRYRVRR